MSGGLRAEAVEVARAGRPVLSGVTLVVPRGAVTALLAPSGRGKSTLLRALVRLEPLASGRVLLDGADVLALDPRELRRRVGLVAQAPAMLPGTVAENVAHGLPSPAPVPAALDAAGVPAALRDRVAAELSGGEQGRVAVARALARSPQALLLDEPTAALDRALADHLGASLRALAADGLAVLVATHDEAWAARFADVRVILDPPA